MKSIAIVSAVADKFYVRKVGATVFGNDSAEFPIDSWAIDDVIAGKVRSLLSGRYDVRPVNYRRSAFVGGGSDSVATALRTSLSSPAAVDAYIVVTKTTSPVGTSNQGVEGLGIVDVSGGALFANRRLAHALYKVNIVDGRDFAVKGGVGALMPGQQPVNPLRTETLRGPHREVDPGMWPATLAAASNQGLRGTVVELIDASLANTLRYLKLIP